MKKQRSEF